MYSTPPSLPPSPTPPLLRAHNSQVRLSASIASVGKPVTVLDAIPAEWFVHRQHRAPEATRGLRVTVNGVEAVCRSPSAGLGCSFELEPAPVVEGCEVDKKALSEAEATVLQVGSTLSCRGERFADSMWHGRAEGDMASHIHDPPTVWVGEQSLCRVEAGHFDAQHFECVVQALPATSPSTGHLRIKSTGSGWFDIGNFVVSAPVAEPEQPDIAPAATVETVVARRQLANGEKLWSEVGCGSGSECVIPKGETWVLDQNADVDTLTVRGHFLWDTTRDNLRLSAALVIVEPGGRFTLGTEDKPMLLRATIYIKDIRDPTNPGKSKYIHPELGDRCFGGYGDGTVIDVHGARINRTWTLLERAAHSGSDHILVRDAQNLGWKVGDLIGIATTKTKLDSEKFRIKRIAPAFDWPLATPTSAVASREHPEWNEVAVNAIDGNENRPANFNGGSDYGDWLRLTLAKPSFVSKVNLLFKTGKAQRQPTFVVECHAGGKLVGKSAEVKRTVDDAAWSTVKLELRCDTLRIFFLDWTKDHHDKKVFEVHLRGREDNAIRPLALFLDKPLSFSYTGGEYTIKGYKTDRTSAEVVNLQRTVVITGDHDKFDSEQRGLHTMVAFPGAIARMTYMRVEFCGQRETEGRYCLHQHYLSHCPKCVLKGNVVDTSHHRGLAVHGTHDTLVQENVLWDARVVGIYMEDGNEMNNTILRNVVICSVFKRCEQKEESGIYIIGMWNDFIENRVANYPINVFTPGGHRANGHGAASGKVCPENVPLRTYRGNTVHHGYKWGLYLNNQYSRNVQLDSDGYLKDNKRWSCQAYLPDGSDNGYLTVIDDDTEWSNNGVGHYSLGDFMYRNYVAIRNSASIYWKVSKNFADGKSAHIRNAVFVDTGFMGPSGPFTFLLENVTLYGQTTFAAGQHCGLAYQNHHRIGSTCTVQYLLAGIDWTKHTSKKRIQFGISGGNPITPTFISFDDSLGGARTVVSRHLDGFEAEGCKPAGPLYDDGYACDFAVRRLNVFAADLDDLFIEGPGYTEVKPVWSSPVLGSNRGQMHWDRLRGVDKRGYGTPVIAGKTYHLNLPARDSVRIEFSDQVLGECFGPPYSPSSLHRSSPSRSSSP